MRHEARLRNTQPGALERSAQRVLEVDQGMQADTARQDEGPVVAPAVEAHHLVEYHLERRQRNAGRASQARATRVSGSSTKSPR